MRAGELVNRIVSASAGLVAVAALGTAVYSTWLTREQQRMSVWPYILQDNSFAGGHYQRFVTNAGLGPALVRSFEVRVDGKPKRDWGEVLQSLDIVPERGAVTFSDIGRGSVLLPGQTYTILEVADSVARAAMRSRVDRMATILCYCSLYRECWLQDSRESEPRPSRCSTGQSTEFARQHAGRTIRTRPGTQPGDSTAR